MQERVALNWEQIQKDCVDLSKKIKSCDVIVSVGRGGLVPSTILSHLLDSVPIYNFGIKSYNSKNKQEELIYDQTLGIKFTSKYRDSRVIVVDDLSDRGTTLNAVKDFFDLQQFNYYKTATLYIKNSTLYVPNYFVKNFDDKIWLDFPWETCKLD